MTSSTAAGAEKLVRQRAVAAIVLSIILIVTQSQRMDDSGGGVLSWALWGTVVLLFGIWASGVFRSQSIRLLINDESSEQHRKAALVVGFWVMLAAAAVCFVLTFVKDYGPRDAIQVIVTTGISAAMLHFGVTERNASRP